MRYVRYGGVKTTWISDWAAVDGTTHVMLDYKFFSILVSLFWAVLHSCRVESVHVFIGIVWFSSKIIQLGLDKA